MRQLVYLPRYPSEWSARKGAKHVNNNYLAKRRRLNRSLSFGVAKVFDEELVCSRLLGLASDAQLCIDKLRASTAGGGKTLCAQNAQPREREARDEC